jgi:hypothetical protein
MEDKVLQSFKKDFLIVKSKGFIESHRTHNTGIGKTFEDVIGIVENNSSLADYEDCLEIKSKRDLSKSMLTLFTKSPSHPKGANSYLRETYGHPDKNNMKILHTTISGAKFNTFFSKIGFKLEVNEKAEKIFILVKDLDSDKIVDDSIYYTFSDLKHIIETKCENIAFINAETKEEDEKEFFYFKEATLLKNLTFEKFIQFVKEGLIVYDIRIGVYGTGKSKGKTHDHGSGFRVLKNNIPKIFTIEEI